MIEVLKQALEALENSQRFVEASANAKMLHGWGEQLDTAEDAITSLRQAIAELESQKPVATLENLEQEIYENTRNFVSLDVMEWMLKRYYTHQPQRTEQNFCPRCGKRTNYIHTCTPPREGA